MVLLLMKTLSIHLSCFTGINDHLLRSIAGNAMYKDKFRELFETDVF